MREDPGATLHEAAASGDIGAVNRLLFAGAGVDERDGEGGTPLMLAADAGHADIVATLLERGADPDAADMYRATALMLAAHRGNADVVRLLLARGANVHARNRDGRTALEVATRRDRGEIRSLLTNAGAADGIVEAALRGDQPKVQTFLDAGESTERQNAKGMTAFIAAASKGDGALMNALLERGADLSLRDSEGDTAFHHAVRHACRSRETAQLALMLTWGADINEAGHGSSPPARCALYPESVSILRFLLEHGADPNGPRDALGQTLLHWAIQIDYSGLAAVEALLDYGADIDGAGALGLTPLMSAVRLRPEQDDAGFQRSAARIRGVPYVKRDARDRLATVRFLIDKGANVNAVSERGSVLSHAAEFGDVALIRLLLEAGADVNGSVGPSPLYRASLFGNREVIALLREHGALGYDPDLVPENREVLARAMDVKIREAVKRTIGARPEKATFMSRLAGKMNEIRARGQKDS